MSDGAPPAALRDSPSRLATFQLAVGWVTVATFLATGLFMRLGYPGVAPPDLAHRVFFRTHHLYLLAAALVNLLSGIHLRGVVAPTPRPRLALAASTLMLVAPPLLLLGFATEHATATLRGGATSFGWYTLAAGAMLHILAWRR
ncbi:MAG TPA: hypothetical protein VGS57_22100 [Thermoanaerobaculia bacterium]|nr:hypothetical protein [Thermoanaerobaculia bacterium]